MFLRNKYFNPVFAGEQDGNGTPDTSGNKPAGGEPTAKTFTEAEVAAIRKESQDAQKKVIEELKAYKTRDQMTAQQRKEQEERIAALENSLLTKEELAQRERDKLSKKYQEDVQIRDQEISSWKSRYTASTISRSITDAAAKNNAFNASQIVALLAPNTGLVAIKGDDGQETGEFEVRVKFADFDKSGKPVTLDLTPEEAVKRMAERDDYMNLFKASGSGGMGGGTARGKAGQIDIAKLAEDPAAYRKAKKDGLIP